MLTSLCASTIITHCAMNIQIEFENFSHFFFLSNFPLRQLAWSLLSTQFPPIANILYHEMFINCYACLCFCLCLCVCIALDLTLNWLIYKKAIASINEWNELHLFWADCEFQTYFHFSWLMFVRLNILTQTFQKQNWLVDKHFNLFWFWYSIINMKIVVTSNNLQFTRTINWDGKINK